MLALSRRWEVATLPMRHQQEAVAKLLPARVGGLFMEMGTGKSLAAIMLAVLRQDKIDRVAWFCPVALKETIRQEIVKHTGGREADVHLFGESTTSATLPESFWHVIGLESVGGSSRVTLAVNALVGERTLCIVDESQYIKGHRAKRTERLTLICARARYRLILTGTPLSQGVVDLYAQMRFLSPKILGYSSFYSFSANHLEYSEKFPGMIVRAHNVAWLAAKIRPYVYQVTKAECLDLPAKLYESRFFRMTGPQAEAYQRAKEEFLYEADPDEWDALAIFRLFTALQQIACGFWNRRTKQGVEHLAFPHHRLEMLMETVAAVPENEKIVIWAKYRRDIESICDSLSDAYGASNVARFYGDTPQPKRGLEVAKFRADARFIVSTQGCGGVGQTWNEAHMAMFYNNAFKFSERLQAEDRIHRIGQAHSCTYVDIHCAGTIDDRIAQALANKGSTVDAFRREVDKIKKSNKERLRELVRAL